jgi:hypothetical protein
MPRRRRRLHDLADRLCALLKKLLVCPLDVLGSEADLEAPPIVLR